MSFLRINRPTGEVRLFHKAAADFRKINMQRYDYKTNFQIIQMPRVVLALQEKCIATAKVY
jgi:hypothetical protein